MLKPLSERRLRLRTLLEGSSPSLLANPMICLGPLCIRKQPSCLSGHDLLTLNKRLKKHRRGHFSTLFYDISHGGGQTSPGNLSQEAHMG
jgi:hypothetical protein